MRARGISAWSLDSSWLGKIWKRKEVNIMNYERPQVTLLATASAAIRAQAKGISPVPDSASTYLSPNAYEADE